MSSSAITLRAATAADEPALGRLGAMLVARHHAFDPLRFIGPTPDTERGYGTFLAGELEQPDKVVLVADEGGRVLGYSYGAVEGTDWLMLRGPAGVIYDLAVDPARRGEGLGRRLLEGMAQRLEALGARQLVLSAAHRNEVAQRLFASAGFRPTMVEMTRDLPPPER